VTAWLKNLLVNYLVLNSARVQKRMST
jgi:hypothetical protein